MNRKEKLLNQIEVCDFSDVLCFGLMSQCSMRVSNPKKDFENIRKWIEERGETVVISEGDYIDGPPR